MMTRLISALCFLLISATVVFADQCALLSNPVQIANAYRYLKEGETIYEYCALCPAPVATLVILKKIGVVKTLHPFSKFKDIPEYKPVAFLLRPPPGDEYTFDGSSYGITVNGEGIDLADTYVFLDGKYWNLAKLVGCPCDFVPTVLPQEKIPQENKGTRGQAF